MNFQKKSMKVQDFKKLAEENKLKGNLALGNVERLYWRNLTFSPPLYGADVPRFISDENLKVCIKLLTILNSYLI